MCKIKWANMLANLAPAMTLVKCVNTINKSEHI